MFVDSINYSYDEMLTANKVGWQFKTIGEKEDFNDRDRTYSKTSRDQNQRQKLKKSLSPKNCHSYCWSRIVDSLIPGRVVSTATVP